MRFDASSGKVVAMVSASGQSISAEQYEAKSIRSYDSRGNLTSCYTAAQGLMSTRTARDGSLIMEWFAPQAVVCEDGVYRGTGEPYKTVSYAVAQVDGARRVTITRQQRGLPPSVITRTEQGNRVTITQGVGDEASSAPSRPTPSTAA